MKISLNWLMDFVPGLRNLADPVDQASRALTAVGFEVEAIHAIGRDLSGLRVAEVLDKQPHPQADKLRVVRIAAGGAPLEVVCGASNVPDPGGLVCWAAPGAKLPGGLSIEARPVRGVMSPGMLCGEDEMGLGEGIDGIIILSTFDQAKPGDDFVATLSVADHVLEVNVTPNRPDALSHIGIARELAAALNLPLQWSEPLGGRLITETAQQVAGAGARAIQIADPEGCPRYQGRFIQGVTVAPSPFVMRTRLAACGVRAISNLVDVTNYILLELGHPLHAFDDARLRGDIVVRRAGEGEAMTTLDGVARTLLPADLVIADQSGPVALAGVMGGATSEVSSDTKTVFLEAATFDPVAIRRTARRLALHSESSHRFERGVDAEGVPKAAERAARMMAVLGGGQVVNTVLDSYPRPAKPRTVQLPLARLRRISGLANQDAKTAAGHLQRVIPQVTVQGQGDATILVAEVPSFRPDLIAAEDLAEEVLRLAGYDTIPANTPVANARSMPSPEGPADRARDRLAAAGLHEIVTWGFVPRASLAALNPDGAGTADPLTAGVQVKNPISADYEVMRTSLLPGLVDTARRNLARGVASPWFFEVGPVIRRRSATDKPEPNAGGPTLPEEHSMAAALVCGHRFGWLRPGEAVDFFDAKQILVELLRGFGINDPELDATVDVPYLHPGVAGVVRQSGVVVARVGEIHPVVRHRLGLTAPAFFLEANLDALATVTAVPRVTLPPRYPAVTRDVSFFVDVTLPAAAVRRAFATAQESLLRQIDVVEDFRDPARVPAGKKSMLWTLTYRADDRTLTDEEVDRAHATALAALTQQLAVDLR